MSTNNDSIVIIKSRKSGSVVSYEFRVAYVDGYETLINDADFPPAQPVLNRSRVLTAFSNSSVHTSLESAQEEADKLDKKRRTKYGVDVLLFDKVHFPASKKQLEKRKRHGRA